MRTYSSTTLSDTVSVTYILQFTAHRRCHNFYDKFTINLFLYSSDSCKCNEQPSHSRRWKSMLIHQGWFTALYTQHKLDSQSFEFEICILQALNMPLIRSTNVFFQGSLSRHITSPSEKIRPESWPGNYMGKATPFWQLSLSHRCHQM